MEINLDTLLYVCGVIASVSAAAAIISKVIKKAIVKTTQESINCAMDKCQKQFNDQLSALNDKLDKYIEQATQTDEDIKKALLAETRDRINQAHDFYMRKGFIGAHSLFVLEELYASYVKLGGNSFIKRQMEDIRSLPVRSAEIDGDILQTGHRYIED